jgi:hypothetical protein
LTVCIFKYDFKDLRCFDITKFLWLLELHCIKIGSNFTVSCTTPLQGVFADVARRTKSMKQFHP